MSTQVLRTDTFEAWRQKANTVAKNLGEVASIDSRISYRTLTHKGAAAYSVGNTLTGSVTGATATVTAVNGVNLVVTPVSGTFVGADIIKSRIYFDGAGTITAGSTITSTQSGATAKILSYDSGDNSAVVYDITGAFSVGNTISGTSKTISNISLDTVSDIGENITNGTTVRELNTYSASAVAGINELQAEVGTIASLSGFSATNLVAVANEIKNSAITFNGAKTFSESVNLAATKELTIAGTSVLNSTTLGSGVVNSSLTTVGTIGTGTWQGSIVSSTYGGTGVNNAGRTLTIATGNLTLTTASGGSSLTLPSTGTVATLAGTETLTSKTINLTSNTLTGTLTQFNAALSDDDFAALAAVQTLTNKSIALGSNTITGTLAQFNTALTDDDFAALAAVQTLTNKTLSTGSIWQGGVISSTYGGTGVNNGGRTLTINTGNVVVTAPAGGSTLTLPGSGTVATLAGIETLTNKTVNLASNTLTGTFAEFNAALTGEDFVGVAAIQTLSNKSVSLTTNTLTGTLAEFNTALTDDDFVAINATQTISNKTFVTPVLGIATATSINKVAITAPATSATLTIANGKTLTASNTLTFTGTDGSSVAFGAGGTVVYTSNNITALSTFSSADLAGRLTDETGTGVVVFNSSPSLTTPTIGGGGANFSGSTSGTTNFKAAAAAGTTTITMPAATGTMALTSDIGNGTLTLSTGVGIVSASASFSANQSGAASYSIAHAVPSGATAATLGTNGISSITTDQFGHITAVTTATYLTAASGVSSIAGTANQITASASVGAVTLSLPQNIHTAAEPTFGGATLGNITVGVSTDNTITTSSGNLILTAAGTSTVNASRPLVAATALTNTNKATVFSVSNSSAGAGADFPYNPTQSTRFSIDSTGNVTINGDLTVAGTTYLPTISGTVAWSTQVTGKTYFGSITDGTTAASPGDGTAFKIRTKDGLTAVVTNDDATHGDNVLFGHGNSITIYGSTSGSVVLQPVAVAGTTTITLPAITGTVVTTGDSGTVTNAMLAGSIATNKLVSSSLTVSAGTGLGGGGSVSLGGSVTLTNAGVLSVNSQTGAVTIAGGTAISVTQASGTVTITNTGVTSAASGTGISISGTGVGPYTGAITITNSDKGSDQAIFKNIAVTGQTTVSAASNTATLNLVGSNITITTDNTTKTVTLTGNAAANNGTITVSAGTGMSGGGSFTVNQSGNSTVTLTNSDPGSSQFIFKNVAVPGQTTIVADTNNDTLTVQAGQVDSTTGIVITTDATTDTLTIAHANTSGQASVDNANGTVIQDITLDTYGHITAIASVDLDARYDARYTLDKVTTAGATTANAITVGGLTVNGNVTVNGTTTSVNTTTANLKDPIVTLGGADNGGNATSDDAKDRGIEFRWHNGTIAKTGFFGWDRSTSSFTFIADATNTNEVFAPVSGASLGAIRAGSFSTGGAATQFLKADGSLDSNTYLTASTGVSSINLGNIIGGTFQSVGSLNGGVNVSILSPLTGSLTGPNALVIEMLTQSGLTAGVYNNVTVNTKGIVTAASNVAYLTSNPNLQTVCNVGNTTTTSITAGSFVKSGAFSTDILKGDGSTESDSNYVKTSGVQTIGGTKVFSANVGIGTSGLSSVPLHINLTLDPSSLAVPPRSIWARPTFRLSNTSNTGVEGIQVQPTVDTAFWGETTSTQITYKGIRIGGVLKTGTTAITETVGLYIDNSTQGTTNNYAIYSAHTGASVFSGSVTATSLIKSGGSSSQLLQADGGSDSVTQTRASVAYLTTSAINVVNGIVKCNGGGTYSAAVADTDYLTPAGASAAYQPKDADLTAIAGLSGTSGLLRKTAADTWSLDTTAYLSGTVGVANGGTGATTFAAGYLKASGTSAFTTVSSISYADLYGTPSLPTDIATSATISAGAITGGAEIVVNYATKNVASGTTGGGGTSVNLLGGSAITVTRSSNNVTITNSGVTSVTQGTGITVSAGTGAVTITNSGVTSITGTSNQVTASASTGGVTLSLPQSINTTANVAFGALDIGSPNPAFGTPTSGEIRAAGNITAYATSDERLKTNIVKIDNALEKVSQIDGIIYDWNDEYKKDHGGVDGYFLRDQNSGVIAQQVEKVFPNVVGERSDGMKAVRYELLVPLLIEAIKDLKAEIESLKANK